MSTKYKVSMSARREHPRESRHLRERIRETMAMHNRCDVETFELLRAWENQIDDDMGVAEDFIHWRRRRGWKAARAVTVPRYIVTK